MFLLALHIVAIGILVMVVWTIAYRRGQTVTERRIRRQLEMEQEEMALSQQAESAD